MVQACYLWCGSYSKVRCGEGNVWCRHVICGEEWVRVMCGAGMLSVERNLEQSEVW